MYALCTAELLYAADKYDLDELVTISTFFDQWSESDGQVKLCALQFRAEVTPDTAADILLLADRHSLHQLKQVGTNKENSRKPYTIKIFLHPELIHDFSKLPCSGGDGEDYLREDKVPGKPQFYHPDEKEPKLVD